MCLELEEVKSKNDQLRKGDEVVISQLSYIGV